MFYLSRKPVQMKSSTYFSWTCIALRKNFTLAQKKSDTLMPLYEKKK